MSRPAALTLRKATRSAFAVSMLAASLCAAAHAQYPGRIKKDADAGPTLRASGVFEWTGDLAKPKAGRLIPLAVWDGQQYQPGGLYLAQPAPLTVLTGTVYELEQAGAPKGLFQVNGAENLGADLGGSQGSSWIAVGSVKQDRPIIAKAKPPMSKHPPQVVKDAGSDDHPTLHRKDGSGGDSSSSSTSSTSSDPDRPTLHRKDSGDASSTSGSGSGSSSGSQTSSAGSQTSGSQTSPSTSQTGSGSNGSSTTASSDPDKPTLHRRDASDSSSGSDSGSGSGSTQSAPADDSDRPTLHKKDSSGDAQNAPSVDPERPTLHHHQDATASGGGPVSFPADPDRPKLRYGKPQVQEGIVEPSKLEGLPMDMNQMAAISDVKTGEPHPYTYSWTDPADAAKFKAAMEDLAQKAIASGFATPTTPANVTKTATKTPAKTATARHKAATPPPLPPLEDEKFNVFELSYNGGATAVLTAKTTGSDGEAKYITLIAQPDFYGNPQTFFKQSTSDKALDIVPRMRLVDAADTDGDGRAELIFELRGKTGRSFGIYRLSSGRMFEAFNTGPLP
jgi:hypothetical protein